MLTCDIVSLSFLGGQGGGGGLGRVVEAVRQVVRIGASNEVEVEVMSVQGHSTTTNTNNTTTTTPPASADVWVSVREETTRYMDPVKLRGLLALYAAQVGSHVYRWMLGRTK